MTWVAIYIDFYGLDLSFKHSLYIKKIEVSTPPMGVKRSYSDISKASKIKIFSPEIFASKGEKMYNQPSF